MFGESGARPGKVENFTPIVSLIGGLVIGLAAVALLLFNGRIAGITGIVANLVDPVSRPWRLAFLGGLLAGGLGLFLLDSSLFTVGIERPLPMVAAAGLLVGFGTRIGNGCTSGHGVCGIGRLSKRSLAATATFIAAGAMTVFVMRVVFGVAP